MRDDFGTRPRTKKAKGGRIGKQVGGPMSTARRDMTHGYYQPDMGMQGGQMFRGGGAVKKKGSVGVALKRGGRIKKKRTPEQLKASADESYGKFGSAAKKSGKINI